MTAVALTPTLRETSRRWRFGGGIAAVVLVLALVALLAGGAFASRAAFAPDNAAPQGGRALAAVLGEHGVTVSVVTRLADARADGRSGTLFVDDRDALLSAAQWRGLAGSTGELVVAAPGTAALAALAPGIAQAGVPSSASVPPGCSLALATRAGGMSLGGVTTSLRATGSTATLCFRDDEGAGQLVSTSVGGTRILLLASVVPFENERIAAAGNAAVAVGALGAHAALTWYVPSALDAASTAAPTLQDLTPAWVTPFMALMLLAGLAAVFWKGRRLGPLAIERLPVVVRSRETVDGRARLYQRSGARLRAADALRIGAIGRIARHLGLSRQASVDDIVVGVAALLGAPTRGIRAALIDSVPGDDRSLVALSDDLAKLEAAVARAVTPGAAPPASGEDPLAPNQDGPAPNQDPRP